jgi:exodeoxyribonuclease VII small subunit
MTEKVTPGTFSNGVDLQPLFEEFRHICEQLEEKGLPLEDSVTLYARGVEIQLKIKRELGRAENRMVEIINVDGTTTPFEPAKPEIGKR